MRRYLCDVALKKRPADIIITNGKFVNVLTDEIYPADVVVADGFVAAVATPGEYTEAREIVDAQGGYITPGLINTHLHVENSMATPEVYCEQELLWGTTTLITDPHEIANVAGVPGIKYMLNAVRNMPINYFVNIPSCVPATVFETAGSEIGVEDIKALLNEPGVLGMGEMMNFPGVIYGDPMVWEKLKLFQDTERVIDGHAPLCTKEELQAYLCAGIATDHECISWEEAREKLRLGMAVLARHGSACHNVETIIKGALKDHVALNNFAFCTDDKHLQGIHNEGTIRYCVKLAIMLGMDPIQAFKIGSINAARIYNMRFLGALAPGYQADIVVWDNIVDLRPLRVFHKGVDAWENLQYKKTLNAHELPTEFLGLVKLDEVKEECFDLSYFKADEEYAIIEMVPGEIVTKRSSMRGSEVPKAIATGDVQLISVFERHHGTGNWALGLLRGYGLYNGAAATTVAHDSHNLIVTGTNPQDMAVAANELIRTQGGFTIVQNGKVKDTVQLEIAGLMTNTPRKELVASLKRIKAIAHAMGVPRDIDPFITLSFMALPVIPSVRITDKGMFDAEQFKFIQ